MGKSPGNPSDWWWATRLSNVDFTIFHIRREITNESKIGEGFIPTVDLCLAIVYEPTINHCEPEILTILKHHSLMTNPPVFDPPFRWIEPFWTITFGHHGSQRSHLLIFSARFVQRPTLSWTVPKKGRGFRRFRGPAVVSWGMTDSFVVDLFFSWGRWVGYLLYVKLNIVWWYVRIMVVDDGKMVWQVILYSPGAIGTACTYRLNKHVHGNVENKLHNSTFH